MPKNTPNCSNKPLRWAGAWQESNNINTIFLTVAKANELTSCRLLIDSLRCFGGELSQALFWVFTPHPEDFKALNSACTRVLPLPMPSQMENFLFGWKVAACALAESQAPSGTQSLVWVDTACLFVQPPALFALDKRHDAAFRPVHIRNVGLPPGEPLDEFWKGIFSAVGICDVTTIVDSFVDGQTLRSYFNSHCFAIDPRLGLMKRWQDVFQRLLDDRIFQARACSDELHQVFLFQAILSAVVNAAVDSTRLLILPPTYNYPYHLQARIPADRQLQALNDSVCVTYEDLSLHPREITGIEVREPLKSWLERRLPHAG